MSKKVQEKNIPQVVKVEAVREIEEERNGVIVKANKLQVCCQDDSDLANIQLKRLNATLKMIKGRFDEIKRPQNEALKQIRALEKDITTPVEEAKCELSNRLMDWRRQEQERIAEETRKVAEENRLREEKAEAEAERRRNIVAAHAAKGHKTKPPTEVPEPEVVPEPAPLEATDTTRVRKVWEYEVTDFNQVPHDYLMINRGAIQDAIRSGTREIPGVIISQIEIPVY